MFNVKQAVYMVERYKTLFERYGMFNNAKVFNKDTDCEPKQDCLYYNKNGDLVQRRSVIWELVCYPCYNYMHYVFFNQLMEFDVDCCGIVHWKEYEREYKRIYNDTGDAYQAAKLSPRVHMHITFKLDNARTASAMSKFYKVEARLFSIPQYDTKYMLDGSLRYLVHGNTGFDKEKYDVERLFGSAVLIERVRKWIDGHTLTKEMVQAEYMSWLYNSGANVSFKRCFEWFRNSGYMQFYNNPQFYRWICDCNKAYNYHLEKSRMKASDDHNRDYYDTDKEYYTK